MQVKRIAEQVLPDKQPKITKYTASKTIQEQVCLCPNCTHA